MQPLEKELKIAEYRDRDTGRTVIRLLPVGQQGSHAYFTSTSYDADGSLILGAEVDGRNQLLRIDLGVGVLHQLTDLPDMRLQSYCVCPAKEIAVVIDDSSLKEVDLINGNVRELFEISDRWVIHTPTVDAAGSRLAFAVSERIERFTATDRIYSTMQENLYFRPRSMVVTVDLDDGRPHVVWGETEWITHVLINPVDPDTVVFCHEGGDYSENRLWVVDARARRKKKARMLYKEAYEEFLVHEYFLADGTLGVQCSVYPEGNADVSDHSLTTSYIMFLDMDGRVVANYRLPGKRSGHVQSNSDNTLIAADRYFPKKILPGEDPEAERDSRCMALNHPEGSGIRVEKLCRRDNVGNTQLAHGHPIFSPDDRHVLYSSEEGGTSSAFQVEI